MDKELQQKTADIMNWALQNGTSMYRQDNGRTKKVQSVSVDPTDFHLIYNLIEEDFDPFESPEFRRVEAQIDYAESEDRYYDNIR